MEKIQEQLLKILFFVLMLIVYFELLVIYFIHRLVSFFPTLFLFDFCLLVGYPLFLRFILKKTWRECSINNYLKMKYILLPWLFMSGAILLYYHNETIAIINSVAEGNGWK